MVRPVAPRAARRAIERFRADPPRTVTVRRARRAIGTIAIGIAATGEIEAIEGIGVIGATDRPAHR